MSITRWFRELRGGGGSSKNDNFVANAADDFEKPSTSENGRSSTTTKTGLFPVEADEAPPPTNATVKLTRAQSALVSRTQYQQRQKEREKKVSFRKRNEASRSRRYSFSGSAIGTRHHLNDNNNNNNNNEDSLHCQGIYRGVENFDYEWRINDKRDPHHYQLQQQQQQYYQRHQCYQSVAEGIATIASSKDRNQPNNNLITTQHVRSCDQTAVHQRSNYRRKNSNQYQSADSLANKPKDCLSGHEKYPCWPSSVGQQTYVVGPDAVSASVTAVSATSVTVASITSSSTVANVVVVTSCTTAAAATTTTTASSINLRTSSSRVDGHLELSTTKTSSAKRTIPGFTQQLKTVMEKCEKASIEMFESATILEEDQEAAAAVAARSRGKIYLPHADSVDSMFSGGDRLSSPTSERDILLKNHHLIDSDYLPYSHSYQDSSYLSQDGDYAECYSDEGRTLLTKAELEQYEKAYEDTYIKPSHQKQSSYAQSEGYHSYVSSNDSAIITPLLDRLRREDDVILSLSEEINKEKTRNDFISTSTTVPQIVANSVNCSSTLAISSVIPDVTNTTTNTTSAIAATGTTSSSSSSSSSSIISNNSGIVVTGGINSTTPAGRESSASASSGSSSDTLKWHGSLSDVSVASSYRSNNAQLIAHSARVQTPQRHHSESVLYLGSGSNCRTNNSHKHNNNNNNNSNISNQQYSSYSSRQPPPPPPQKMNSGFGGGNSQMRKLYPIASYTAQQSSVSVCDVSFGCCTTVADSLPSSSSSSMPAVSLTVAERIIELEKQHQEQQQQQSSKKYTYLDPDKRHKVTDRNLKVIQKKALLSYYERHHSAWRSEPQLSPVPVPPPPQQPSSRPRLPTPTSGSPSADERSTGSSPIKENIPNAESEETPKPVVHLRTSSVGDVNTRNAIDNASSRDKLVRSSYSSSCGSLRVSDSPGPLIMGPSISVDDWVPELPPKKVKLRSPFTPQRIASPDFPPPPSPPPYADDEVFDYTDEPLPPPPPEIIAVGVCLQKNNSVDVVPITPPARHCAENSSLSNDNNNNNNNNSKNNDSTNGGNIRKSLPPDIVLSSTLQSISAAAAVTNNSNHHHHHQNNNNNTNKKDNNNVVDNKINSADTLDSSRNNKNHTPTDATTNESIPPNHIDNNIVKSNFDIQKSKSVEMCGSRMNNYPPPPYSSCSSSSGSASRRSSVGGTAVTGPITTTTTTTTNANTTSTSSSSSSSSFIQRNSSFDNLESPTRYDYSEINKLIESSKKMHHILTTATNNNSTTNDAIILGTNSIINSSIGYNSNNNTNNNTNNNNNNISSKDSFVRSASVRKDKVPIERCSDFPSSKKSMFVKNGYERQSLRYTTATQHKILAPKQNIVVSKNVTTNDNNNNNKNNNFKPLTFVQINNNKFAQLNNNNNNNSIINNNNNNGFSSNSPFKSNNRLSPAIHSDYPPPPVIARNNNNNNNHVAFRQPVERFPDKLDPRCPPTSYQLSQSSYRREPRDRGEKGMPNCEGSYKRTMSPCRNNNGVITNCVSNGNINSKDIENIEPSASNGGSILSDIIGRFSNKSTINTNHQDNNNVIKSHHHHHHHHNHHAVVKAGSFNNGNSNNHTALSNNAAPTTRGAANNRYSAPVHHQQLTFSSVSTGGSSSSCSNESNNQISSSASAAESGSNAINNKNNGNIINNNNTTTRKPEDNIQRLPPPPDYSQTLPRNYAVSVTSSATSSATSSSFTSVMTSSAYTENNGLLISGKPRNVRSPRTHSDPSSTNLPNNTNGGDSSSSCCNNNNNNSNSQGQDLGLRLLANSSETALSSSSSETMMPRSQSDLSTVGSVESGYSSLSLNVVPSPSSSPTRLSSSSSSSDNRNSSLILTSFADSSTNNNNVPTIKKKKKNDRFVAETEATSISSIDKSNCCVETQCDIITSNIDERPHSKKNSVVQRSELLVLRIGAATSDASCQTDHAGGNDVIISSSSSSGSSDHHCSGKSLRNNDRKSVSSPFSCRDSSTSPMFRQKLQEEIDCEQLSLDLISHLSPNDKLLGILVPKPESKTSIDYVSGLFPTNMILPSRSRTCSTTPVIDTISSVKSSSLGVSNAASQSEDCSRLQEGRNLSPRFMQPAKSESSNLSSNSGSINCIGGTQSSSQSLNGLRKKKEELICRLDRKLNILREEQVSIMEECRLNEVLGNVVSEKVNTVASAHEASKFRIHVEEIGHITSLLLGLSGRLARVENTLLELAQDDNNGDRKLLESKRDKLSAQLEEAKALKDNIDRRSKSLSVMLHRYFTEDEFADYNYFVNMKSKLLIDSREIADKIQLGEEQLIALKETLSNDN